MKKLLTFLFMISVAAYSANSFDSRIFDQRVSTRLGVTQFIRDIETRRQPKSGEVMGDMFSADEIIKKFNETDISVTRNLIVLLPDVKLFKEDLTKLSKAADHTTVFLATKDYGIPYFEDRTFSKFQELEIDLEKYGNINLILLDLTKEELEEALVATFMENNTQNNKLYIKVNSLR